MNRKRKIYQPIAKTQDGSDGTNTEKDSLMDDCHVIKNVTTIRRPIGEYGNWNVSRSGCISGKISKTDPTMGVGLTPPPKPPKNKKES